jgi:hypothetical protein
LYSTLLLGTPVILERVLVAEGTGSGEQGAEFSNEAEGYAHPAE